MSKSYVANKRKIFITNSMEYAIRQGRFEEVRELIDTYGFHYSENWKGGYTLLCEAIQYEQTAIARLLLSKGARFNSMTSEYIKPDTPLHLAVKNGETEILNIILDKGGDVNDQNLASQSPLHCAVEGDNIDIIELLVMHGANVNAVSHIGLTPLHHAVIIDNLNIDDWRIQIVEKLLMLGADVNCVCESKKSTPLLYAAANNKIEIITLLLKKGADVNFQRKDGSTALHIAARCGCPDLVQVLLKFNANVNLRDKMGCTPLHNAVEGVFEYISTMLLKNGANVDTKRNDGNTALHIAVMNDHKELVKILLTHGAEADLKNEKGFSPLHLGVQNKNLNIVMMILKFDADIDSKDDQGRTALHLASHYGCHNIVKFLLKYGPDINITCNKGQTALDYAMKGIDVEHDIIIEVLELHIVKLRAANLYLKTNLYQNSYNHGMYNYIHKYECEIAEMISDEIKNTNVSVYNILTKGINALAIYMRNKNIVLDLQSKTYRKKYPLYCDLIDSNFKKGLLRKKLLEQSLILLKKSLPNNCILEIYSYLDNKDLRMILKVCNP